jgi:hypothetical protein
MIRPPGIDNFGIRIDRLHRYKIADSRYCIALNGDTACSIIGFAGSRVKTVPSPIRIIRHPPSVFEKHAEDMPLERGDALDLDFSAFRKGLYRNTRTSRIHAAEKSLVHLVHSGKIGHIGEENGGFDNPRVTASGFRQNRLHIVERALCLIDGTFREFPVFISIPSCPDTKRKPFAFTACTYGPIAAGALSVPITSLDMMKSS